MIGNASIGDFTHGDNGIAEYILPLKPVNSGATLTTNITTTTIPLSVISSGGTGATLRATLVVRITPISSGGGVSRITGEASGTVTVELVAISSGAGVSKNVSLTTLDLSPVTSGAGVTTNIAKNIIELKAISSGGGSVTLQPVAFGTVERELKAISAGGSVPGGHPEYIVVGVPDLIVTREDGTITEASVMIFNMANQTARIFRSDDTRGQYETLTDITVVPHTDSGLDEFTDYKYMAKFVIEGEIAGVAVTVTSRASPITSFTFGKNRSL